MRLKYYSSYTGYQFTPKPIQGMGFFKVVNEGLPAPLWEQGIPDFDRLLPAASQPVGRGKSHPQMTILGVLQISPEV